MNLRELYQFIETHRETIILPATVIALFAAGLFFVDDLWLGWVARTSVCPPPTTSCTLTESMRYVSAVTNSGVTLDETYLKDRTALELGSLMEVVRARPAIAPHAQDLNTALTKVRDQITSAVAADEKVYGMVQQGTISPKDLDYVTHRIRVALVEQMEQYIASSMEKESSALERSLSDILPEEATSLSLSKLLEDRSTNYIGPGERFIIEKLQVEGTRSDGNIFDTVSVVMTVQSTAAALERFLEDVNTSGAFTATGATKPLPLMRITQTTLTSMGSTSPESSIDTPRPVYRGDIRLETYIRALTEDTLKPLQQEVTQLREKAKTLQTTALLRPGADGQKILQLFDLANNSEKLLEAAMTQKDLRSMQDQLATLKELYQTIIGSYNAS